MDRLNQLHPKVKELALQHIQKCKEAGIDLCIYCTYRSIEEQNALYAQGRTKPGKIVTRAKGGQSFHNYRVAYDCAPIVNGRIAWGRSDLLSKSGRLGNRWV
jgi:peptidoglycan L-alanyl-D-glutamate endopeptidase CwlK